MDFFLEGSATPVKLDDINQLKLDVGYEFPLSFTEIYLANNGGAPSKGWWDSEDDYEPIMVADFKIIALRNARDKKDTKYIGGCFGVMAAKNVIPSNIIPFACDEGGSFFCIDKNSGGVIFYTTDNFQPDLEMTLNHVNSQRWLASSFEVFISGLQSEEEIEMEY